MTSERAIPGQLTFDLGGGHPAVGDAADLAIASAYSRAPPGVHGDHEEVSTFGMGAGTVPVYGRLNGRSLPEALREGWRKADELNAQQPADGESVPVAAIDVRLSLQPRERLEDDAVKQYAAALTSCRSSSCRGTSSSWSTVGTGWRRRRRLSAITFASASSTSPTTIWRISRCARTWRMACGSVRPSASKQPSMSSDGATRSPAAIRRGRWPGSPTGAA